MKTVEDLNNRRIFKWGDFLEEILPKIGKAKLNKDEKMYLKKLVERGDDLQEQLNEPCMGYMTFTTYYKQINKFINLQNDIIQDINTFLDEIIEYKEVKNEKNNKQNNRISRRNANFG